MENQEQAQGSNQEKVQAAAQSTESAKDDFVRRQAYEEVSADMHKYKKQLKEYQAQVNEMKTALQAKEREELEKQEQWQKLYEQERSERERIAQERARDQDLMKRTIKMSALKQELGNIRDEYLMHADIDGIEINEDGTLSSESVQLVANKFRQDHPTLIPQTGSSNITGRAPSSSQTFQSQSKSLSDMSYEERVNLLKKMKQT